MTVFEFLGRWYRPAGPDLGLRIDDRTLGDKSPDFCAISLHMKQNDSIAFDLVLSPVPWDEHVESAAAALNGSWSGSNSTRTLTVSLTTTDITLLRKLAEAIRKVAGKGRRYSNPNWKWTTRRAAGSLQKLADWLKDYRQQARKQSPSPRTSVIFYQETRKLETLRLFPA
jgi:hypothetical protein